MTAAGSTFVTAAERISEQALHHNEEDQHNGLIS